jgi:subtilisin family serine protease
MPIRALTKTKMKMTKFREFMRRVRGLSLVLVMTVSAIGAKAKTQYVEGEVLVTFKPTAALASAQQALGVHSLQLTKHFPLVSMHRGSHCGLVRDHNRSTAQLIKELSADPAIASVEPNYLRWTSGAPNDPLFNQMWGLNNTGASINGVSGTPRADIKFVNAWNLAQVSTNPVVVAVIDTGVDYNHPDLAGNMWTNAGEIANNGSDDDDNGYVDDFYGYDFADGTSDPSDSGFHGTHVAGTIGAVGNNKIGVIGVAYQARIMALRASSDGSSFTDSAIIEALQYATMMKQRGVNIVAVNASFGGGGSNSVERAAIQAAGDAGIIFCAAAGNSSANHDVSPDFPSSYRLSNMIVVAATTQNDQLASFSDFGAHTVDLGAPGVNIWSAMPTNLPSFDSVVQLGTNSYSANAITYSGTTPGITAGVYDCGLGYPTNFPASVSGNIALIKRGTLTFVEKVSNAMAAGATAAVIYNNQAGNFDGTLQNAGNWIPSLSLAEADGIALQGQLPSTATVVNAEDFTRPYQILDGTSMATPHVAGAVAFAAMNFPDETFEQRIQRILANVDVVPGLQGQVITGGRLNLQRIVDTDGNGLPDWWELQYFGHLTGTDPNADADGDGASNLAEWIAGTDPQDPISCLRALIPSPKPTSGFVVQWPSVAGKTYRLERATNLVTGFDSVVRTNIVGTPPFNSEPDAATLPGGSRYYRVEVEQ